MRRGNCRAFSLRNTLIVDITDMIRIVTNRKVGFRGTAFLMISSTARATVISTSIVVALFLALIVFEERRIAKRSAEFNALVVVKFTSRVYT